MAKKTTKSDDQNVTRISASDNRDAKKTPAKKAAAKTATKATTKVSAKAVTAKKATTKKTAAAQPKIKKESRGLIGYVKGAWYELKQVRWPTRRATWELTGAVMAFSAFFILFIFAMDTLFNYLFDTILK